MVPRQKIKIVNPICVIRTFTANHLIILHTESSPFYTHRAITQQQLTAAAIIQGKVTHSYFSGYQWSPGLLFALKMIIRK